jgi:hypothetical protein
MGVRRAALQHLLEKWGDFSDEDMLHLIEMARILDRKVSRPD